MPIEPEAFKLRDAASYDAVAERFEFWSHRVTSALAHELVERAELTVGDRVLDLGTGSGVVALAAAERVGLSGAVLGVDLSEGMLDIARRKCNSTGFAAPVQFRRMDAERLEFEEASFNAGLSLFALLHFPNPERAVRELFRVLTPGGHAAIGIGNSMPFNLAAVASLWSRLQERAAMRSGLLLVAPQALERYVESVIPQAAEHEAVSAARAQSLVHLMRKAGFRNIRKYWKDYTHQIDTAADFWDLQTTFSSVVRKRLESARKEIVTGLREEFQVACQAVLERGGKLIYRNAALIVTAIRPENPRS